MYGNSIAQGGEHVKPHYILCGPDKRPISTLGWNAKSWQNNPASQAQAIKHWQDGGLVGIIPASVGILVVDVDGCPEGKTIVDLLKEVPFRYEAVASKNHNGGHILVRWDGKPQGNRKWQWQGYSGEIRHAKGYAIIWNRQSWADAARLQPITSIAQFERSKVIYTTNEVLAMAKQQTRNDKADWSPGARNDTLNKLAFKAALRDAGEVEFNELRERALAAGLGYGEIDATIASARAAAQRNQVSKGDKSAEFVGKYIDDMDITLAWNEVTHRIEWRDEGTLQVNNDQFEGWLRNKIRSECHTLNASGKPRPLKFSESEWAVVMNAMLAERHYNPYREWIDSLPQPDLDINLLETALLDESTFAADDTPLNREWLKLVMVGMVMRIYDQGAHFRYMPILTGEQNVGKSTFLRELVPFPGWASETLELHASVKEQEEGLRGKLLTECSELSGMRRADIEKLKAMITRTRYTGRLPYAKSPVDIPRTGIIIGTTNSDTPLPHDSSNTRFIVMHCNKRWTDIAGWMRRNRDQLWAEARALYIAGYRPYLTDALEVAQANANAELTDRDEGVETRLMDYILNEEHRFAIEKDGLLVADFLDYIEVEHRGLGKVYAKTVTRALQAYPFGFTKHRRRVKGKKERRWCAPDGWFRDKPTQDDMPF